jgi:hypothetical protein
MITAKAGPATVRSPYEVTGYDPPSRLAGHGVAGPVRFQLIASDLGRLKDLIEAEIPPR